MMRALLLTGVIAGCGGGVSDSPPAGWDDALTAFANAHCEWNYTCDGRNEPTCVAETTGVMTTSRTEVPAGQESACIECMAAWTEVYIADTSPCVSQLTFDQQQAITAACTTINCVELHDLPGTSPGAGGA